MDVYLDKRFATYRGVSELIEWCSRNAILFMINTPGMKGYFQLAFQKDLMPKTLIVSAHPMIACQDKKEPACGELNTHSITKPTT